MGKLMRSFLAFIIVLSLCIPIARAADEPALTLSSGEVQPGGSVTLTVSIKDNPGLSAAMVFLYYDTSVFTVDPARDVAAQGVFRQTGGVIGNTIAAAKANGRYYGEADQDGVLALWYNGSGINTTGDGALLAITLHANAAAANGSYTVRVGSSSTDTRSRNGEEITLGTSSAAVAVTGGTAARPQPEPPASPSEGGSPGDAGAGSQSGRIDTPSGGVSDGRTGAPSESVSGQPESGGGNDFEAHPQPETPFKDVAGHWAEEIINQAAQMQLVLGYNGLYRPDNNMTRAELVTVLWRVMGSPAPGGRSAFTDLTQDWYLDAVAWAEKTGVVMGVGQGRFDPDGDITREQLAAILYRMAGSRMGTEAMFTSIYDAQYGDSGQIGAWAKPAVYWAVYNEIYCGESSLDVGNTLAPTAAANRAQIAVMIVRYLGPRE